MKNVKRFPKDFPFCSILVINYNGKKYLEDCFDSLRRINYPKSRYEVIMIDNASADNSIKFVIKKFPWVKVLKLDKNYGFGGGCNKGIEMAKGEYFVIINNDIHVDKEWLIELTKVARSGKKIGICGSKIVEFGGGAGGEGRLSIFGVPTYFSKHNELEECFWVSDCSMLIKKEVVDNMGELYDPSYFMYFEEVDTCWRARLLGYNVFYVPSSIVYHLGSATASKMGNIMKFYHYRNKIWTFKKNSRFPLTQLFMVPIFISTFFMILYFTATKKWNYGISVLKYVFSKKEKTPGINRISLKDQLKLFFI